MANKILTSDGAGKYKEVSADSISVEQGNLSASTLILSTASFAINNGILYVENGIIKNVTGSSANKSLQYVEGSGLIAVNDANRSYFTGDINGTVSTQVKANSINNVISGNLSSSYGGTNLSLVDSSLINGAEDVEFHFDYEPKYKNPLSTTGYRETSKYRITTSIQGSAVINNGPAGTGSINGTSCLFIDSNTTTGSVGISFFRKGLQDKPFTLETWIYLTSTNNTSGSTLFDLRSTLATNTGSVFTIGTDRRLSFSYYNTSSIVAFTGNSQIPLNTWTHVAFSRYDTGSAFYINGIQDASSINYGANEYIDILRTNTAVTAIGLRLVSANSSSVFKGYIDRSRISLQTYTASFTPERSEFRYNIGSIAILGQSTPNYNYANLASSVTSSYLFASNGGDWRTRESSFSPSLMTGTLVYLYTGSVGTDTTLSWTKPTGCRFVRVICQAGGGAGGSTSYGATRVGSGGGGGGGYSEAVFNAYSLSSSVTVTAGKGGLRVVPAGGGQSGGNSIFGSSASPYLLAIGGGGGGDGLFAENGGGNSVGGSGGAGFTDNGGNGGKARTRSVVGQDSLLAGAGGGGGGGQGDPALTTTYGLGGGNVNRRPNTFGANGALVSNSANNPTPSGLFEFNSIYVNNSFFTSSIPNLYCGGGGGGGAASVNNSSTAVAGSGSSPTFGSGGGGGGEGLNGYGGNGGVGYVMIICY